MRKIPTVFFRDYTPGSSGRYVRPEVNPECEWVLAGDGVATRKWDGAAVLIDADGSVWARREVKTGRLAPAGFRPVETDTATGKTVGWERAGQSGWVRFIMEAMTGANYGPGTYELVGPKVNNNPEGFAVHTLVLHGDDVLDDVPRDFDGLREYLLQHDIEGIVFWRDPGNPDGGMAKIKRKDFRSEA